jgi:hypothetical protein
MSIHEAVKFSNFATDQTFNLTQGGLYMGSVVATFGGGSVKLQILGPDGTTYLDIFAAYDAAGAEQDEPINSWTAAEAKALYLSPGAYRLHVTTASAIYASVVRIPTA